MNVIISNDHQKLVIQLEHSFMKIQNNTLLEMARKANIQLPSDVDLSKLSLKIKKDEHGKLKAQAKYTENVKGVDQEFVIKAVKEKKSDKITCTNSKNLKKLVKKDTESADVAKAGETILKAIIYNYKEIKELNKSK